jgi:hypothetical protein
MCCICLIEDNKYISLDCGHKLHKSCLNKLLEYNNKCPMCRKKIFKEDICNCPIFSPYILGGDCRYCFGIHIKDFKEKYKYIYL